MLLSGAWILPGAVLVMVGLWPDLGVLMLAAFLLPTAVIMHPFGREQDSQTESAAQINFHKDLSPAGAVLALFGHFVAAGAGLQVTGPLFASPAG